MKDITKKYTNGEVTIIWKPDLCIHSRKCFTGLPDVFDPQKRPWITPERSTTDKIIEQVKKCPSGALSYVLDRDSGDVPEETIETMIEPSPNGPLMIYGNLSIKDKDGAITKKNKVTAFCRCGASGNKPYCDGSHKKIGFTA